MLKYRKSSFPKSVSTTFVLIVAWNGGSFGEYHLKEINVICMHVKTLPAFFSIDHFRDIKIQLGSEA